MHNRPKIFWAVKIFMVKHWHPQSRPLQSTVELFLTPGSDLLVWRFLFHLEVKGIPVRRQHKLKRFSCLAV